MQLFPCPLLNSELSYLLVALHHSIIQVRRLPVSSHEVVPFWTFICIVPLVSTFETSYKTGVPFLEVCIDLSWTFFCIMSLLFALKTCNQFNVLSMFLIGNMISCRKSILFPPSREVP